MLEKRIFCHTMCEDIPEFDEMLDDKTAQVVYDELGYQIDKIDNVLEAYEDNELEEIDSYNKLEKRRARFARMRGILQTSSSKNLS
jgi:hypothetical protein